MNRNIRLAEKELIEFVKGVNNGKSFFFNLSVPLLVGASELELYATGCYWGQWLVDTVLHLSNIPRHLLVWRFCCAAQIRGIPV